MNRKIGFFLSHEQFAPGELVELAVAAEEAGFDSVWASDHFQPWQANQGHAGQAWLTLAAVGQRTSRVQLGTAVTCPIYRHHPANVAQAFATLGSLYPGRVFLGLGTGEAVNELAAGGGWGPYAERNARLREAVGLIRALWTGDVVSHDGAAFSVSNARIWDLPPEPVPIYIAAAGPKSAALAGELGDGWITDPSTLLGRPEVGEAFRSAAAQRSARGLAVLVEPYVFIGDRDEALAAAQPWQFGPIMMDILDIDDPREIDRLARERSTPERTVEPWLISRDPAEHVAHLQRLFAAGATHLAVHSVQPGQRSVIDFYAREVLPHVRQTA